MSMDEKHNCLTLGSENLGRTETKKLQLYRAVTYSAELKSQFKAIGLDKIHGCSRL